MRRITLVVFLAVVLALTLSVSASELSAVEDLTALARYAPEDSVLFAATRIDDEFINTVQASQNRMNELLSQLMPFSGDTEQLDIRDILDQAAMQGFGGNFAEAVRPWLGDHMAMAIDAVGTGEPGVVIAVEITDKAAALAALQSAPNAPAPTEGPNGFTIFADSNTGNGVVAVGEGIILITNIFDSIPQERPASLAESDVFRNTLSQLPEPAYWGVAYLDLPLLMKVAPNADREMVLDYITANYGPMAIGAVLRNLQVSLVDIVQTTTQQGAMSFTPVNLDFAAQYVPADVSILVHGRDINTMYQSLLELLSQIARFNGATSDMQANLSAAYAQLSSVLGMEFPNEVLGWMNSDFVAYTRFDRDELLNMLEASVQNKTYAMETFPTDFAFVVAVGDEALAAEFVDSIGALLRIMLVQAEQAIVREESIGGVDGYTIRFSIPVGNDIVPYEIALASNGEVVTLATRHLAEEILSGGPVTARYAPNFTEAQEFFLSNASGVIYMDAIGLTMPVATSLAVLGPAANRIFENIIEGLDATSTPSSPRLLAQGGDFIDGVRKVIEFFHSVTVTAATNEQGNLIIRISSITS